MTGERAGGRVLVAGSANVDYVVRAPRIPAPGETVLGGDLTVLPGGKGANQAVACARAGGAATAMLAALGDDAGGALLAGSLADAGVTLQRVASERPTGAALITVSDGAENAITVAPGANMTLAPGDLPDLADTGWLLLQLEVPLATVAAYAQAARAAGVKVMLNAAPAQALPRELLRQVDVLVANEAELALLSGGAGTIAAQLADTGATVAVVTLGARGCLAWSSDEYVAVPAFAVAAVDTTAAGDTFCGVVAAALADGTALPAALRIASAAAALSTTRAGAQASIPAATEVTDFFADRTTDAAAIDALRTYCGIA